MDMTDSLVADLKVLKEGDYIAAETYGHLLTQKDRLQKLINTNSEQKSHHDLNKTKSISRHRW